MSVDNPYLLDFTSGNQRLGGVVDNAGLIEFLGGLKQSALHRRRNAGDSWQSGRNVFKRFLYHGIIYREDGGEIALDAVLDALGAQRVILDGYVKRRNELGVIPGTAFIVDKHVVGTAAKEERQRAHRCCND